MHQLIEDFILATKLEGKHKVNDRIGDAKTFGYTIEMISLVLHGHFLNVLESRVNRSKIAMVFRTHKDCVRMFRNLFGERGFAISGCIYHDVMVVKIVDEPEYIYEKLCSFEDIVKEVREIAIDTLDLEQLTH